jgi:hypothetical protein
MCEADLVTAGTVGVDWSQKWQLPGENQASYFHRVFERTSH